MNVADSGTKVAEVPPARAVAISSDRVPVPIARKPILPSADEAVASSQPEPNERHLADQPAALPPDGARPDRRVVISRGNQSDYVVIPVDRHFVVIRGWRIQKEAGGDSRRGSD